MGLVLSGRALTWQEQGLRFQPLHPKTVTSKKVSSVYFPIKLVSLLLSFTCSDLLKKLGHSSHCGVCWPHLACDVSVCAWIPHFPCGLLVGLMGSVRLTLEGTRISARTAYYIPDWILPGSTQCLATCLSGINWGPGSSGLVTMKSPSNSFRMF